MQFTINPDIQTPISLGAALLAVPAAVWLYRLDKRSGDVFKPEMRPASRFWRAIFCALASFFIVGLALPAPFSLVLIPLASSMLGGEPMRWQGEVVSIAPGRKRSVPVITVKLSNNGWATARPTWWFQAIEPKVICGARVGESMLVIGYVNYLGQTYQEFRAPACTGTSSSRP